MYLDSIDAGLSSSWASCPFFYVSIILVLCYTFTLVWSTILLSKLLPVPRRKAQKGFLCFIILESAVRMAYFIVWPTMIQKTGECTPNTMNSYSILLDILGDIPICFFLSAFTLYVFTFARVHRLFQLLYLRWPPSRVIFFYRFVCALFIILNVAAYATTFASIEYTESASASDSFASLMSQVSVYSLAASTVVVGVLFVAITRSLYNTIDEYMFVRALGQEEDDSCRLANESDAPDNAFFTSPASFSSPHTLPRDPETAGYVPPTLADSPAPPQRSLRDYHGLGQSFRSAPAPARGPALWTRITDAAAATASALTFTPAADAGPPRDLRLFRYHPASLQAERQQQQRHGGIEAGAAASATLDGVTMPDGTPIRLLHAPGGRLIPALLPAAPARAPSAASINDQPVLPSSTANLLTPAPVAAPAATRNPMRGVLLVSVLCAACLSARTGLLLYFAHWLEGAVAWPLVLAYLILAELLPQTALLAVFALAAAPTASWRRSYGYGTDLSLASASALEEAMRQHRLYQQQQRLQQQQDSQRCSLGSDADYSVAAQPWRNPDDTYMPSATRSASSSSSRNPDSRIARSSSRNSESRNSAESGRSASRSRSRVPSVSRQPPHSETSELASLSRTQSGSSAVPASASGPAASLARPIPIPASPGFPSPAADAQPGSEGSGRPVYSSYTHSLARSLVEAVLFQGQSVQSQSRMQGSPVAASVTSTYVDPAQPNKADHRPVFASVASVPAPQHMAHSTHPPRPAHSAVAASGPGPASALQHLHRAASAAPTSPVDARIPAAPRSTRATAPRSSAKPVPAPPARDTPPSPTAASPPARVPSSLASSFMGSPSRFSHSPAPSRSMMGFSRAGDDDEEAMASFTRSMQGTLTSELDESLLQADGDGDSDEQ